MMNQEKLRSCDCVPDAMPYLIFDNRVEQPIVKKRVKATWKSLSEVKDAILRPPSDEPIKVETPEPVQESEGDDVRLLFEKMLSMRMDQQALAISDDYRTRPQVCVCDNVCCNCFDYSNFLHNLKLHNHKELLRVMQNKMTNKSEKKFDPKPKVIEPFIDGEEESNREDIYDEFTMKNEEDYEGDDPNDVDLDLSIIDNVKKRICFEKTICPEKKVPKAALKKKRGVRVINIDEPPYETKCNTVHQRVREFDPNAYKTHVREEIKRLNAISAPERGLGAENRGKQILKRPPWKI